MHAHSLHIRTLAAQPTLSYGQCCDLKINNANGGRWWLCRLPANDTNHRVTIEKYNDTTRAWEPTQVLTDKGEQ